MLTLDGKKELIENWLKIYNTKDLSFEFYNPSRFEGYLKQQLEETDGFLEPRKQAVYFNESRNNTEEELRTTFNHEVLGHYALNTFTADEKRRLLDVISNSKNSSEESSITFRNNTRSIESLWTEIEKHYDYKYLEEKIGHVDRVSMWAEEVFAHVAEVEVEYDNALSEVLMGEKNLRSILKNEKETLTINELKQITESLKAEMTLELRQQQNFPNSDHEQYKLMELKRLLSTDLTKDLTDVSIIEHESQSSKINIENNIKESADFNIQPMRIR